MPNKQVKASIKKKLITVPQPHVITKKDVNSNSNGLSSTRVESTAKTRRPQPRSNTKKDKNDKSKVVCATCKQCWINVNHDVCVLNYVNGMNSTDNNQGVNVSIANQKKHMTHAKKPMKSGSKERLAFLKPSKLRTCLRWSPTGKKFDLSRKLIIFSNSECKSDTSVCDDASPSNPHEPTSKWFPNSNYFLGRVKTPQRNEVVERRNQTLVEAARTMLIYSCASLFLWAEAIATVALCYPKNDQEDIGKLGAKAPAILKTSHDVDELQQQQQHSQQQENQAQIQPKVVANNGNNAVFDKNMFINPFAPPSTGSAESSSHNIKEAMTNLGWIDSMEYELLQFKQLDVWEYRSRGMSGHLQEYFRRNLILMRKAVQLRARNPEKMETCNPIGTPMETKHKLNLDKNGTPIDATKYQSMIGALMYLTSSRPHIVRATCLCARYQAQPIENHLKEITRDVRTPSRVLSAKLNFYAKSWFMKCNPTVFHGTEGAVKLEGLRKLRVFLESMNVKSARRRSCGRETAHAVVEKKGKAKGKYHGKLFIDLGNEVRSNVEQGMAAMEKLIEKLGNDVRSNVKKELEEARSSNTFLCMLNKRVKRDLYCARVQAHDFYQEMIRRGFMFEERPNEAINVLIEIRRVHHLSHEDLLMMLSSLVSIVVSLLIMPLMSAPLTQATILQMIKKNVDTAIAAERARQANVRNDARGSGPVMG
nr:hypothetical protein [Tanacetum cinerariifolium]